MNKKQIFCISILLVLFVVYMYYYINIYIYELREKEEIQKINSITIQDDSLFPDNNKNNTMLENNISMDSTEKDVVINNSQRDSLEEPRDTKSDTSDLFHERDCIISIPSINLEKFVYTGTGREDHLQEYDLITAAVDMKYINGGNYIICGHASRIYGHSLNRLKEIKVNDKIYIKYNNTIDEYCVTSITYESMINTSSYCKQSEQQIITIISCAKYIAENQYIVIKGEKQ